MKLTVEGCLGLVAWINGDQHHGRRHCIDLQQWKQQLQPYTTDNRLHVDGHWPLTSSSHSEWPDAVSSSSSSSAAVSMSAHQSSIQRAALNYVGLPRRKL